MHTDIDLALSSVLFWLNTFCCETSESYRLTQVNRLDEAGRRMQSVPLKRKAITEPLYLTCEKKTFAHQK